jgi:hypothetical protein
MNNVLFRSLETVTLVAFAAAVGATPGSAQSSRTDRDAPANLTGAWTLNKDLSDDAAKLLEAMQGRDLGGSGAHRPPAGGGHGPGMHGGGGGGRGGMTPEQMRAMRARMSDVLESPTKLTIVHADASVTLTDNHGRSQRLTLNNKKEMRPVDNRMVEVRTRCDDDRLVNETWLGDGLKLTETYALASGGRQLQVSVKVDGSHLPRPMKFRRIYDAVSLR